MRFELCKSVLVRRSLNVGEDFKGDEEGLGVHRRMGEHVHRMGRRGVLKTGNNFNHTY